VSHRSLRRRLWSRHEGARGLESYTPSAPVMVHHRRYEHLAPRRYRAGGFQINLAHTRGFYMLYTDALRLVLGGYPPAELHLPRRRSYLLRSCRYRA